MIFNVRKTLSGLSIIFVGACLLNACNTVQGTATGVKETAYGVEQTVKDTTLGAEKDIKKVVVAKSVSNKHQPMGTNNHEPAG